MQSMPVFSKVKSRHIHIRPLYFLSLETEGPGDTGFMVLHNNNTWRQIICASCYGLFFSHCVTSEFSYSFTLLISPDFATLLVNPFRLNGRRVKSLTLGKSPSTEHQLTSAISSLSREHHQIYSQIFNHVES